MILHILYNDIVLFVVIILPKIQLHKKVVRELFSCSGNQDYLNSILILIINKFLRLEKEAFYHFSWLCILHDAADIQNDFKKP